MLIHSLYACNPIKTLSVVGAQTIFESSLQEQNILKESLLEDDKVHGQNIFECTQKDLNSALVQMMKFNCHEFPG